LTWPSGDGRNAVTVDSGYFCELEIDVVRLAVGRSFLHVEVYIKVAVLVKENLVQLS